MNQSTRLLPIIAITASAFQENRREVKNAGGDDFMGKPFRERELYDKVGRLTGAEYVYAEEQTNDEVVRPSSFLSKDKIATAVPADLREQLRDATLRADLDDMLAVVDRIQTRAPEIANELRRRLQSFDYQSVLSLLESEVAVS